MYRALAFIVGLFHLWVMITFAAIVVPCLTRAESKPFLRLLVLGIYVVSAIVLTGRWLAGMAHLVPYREVLYQGGLTQFPTPHSLSMR